MVDDEELGERFRQLAVAVVAARTTSAHTTIAGVELARPHYGHHSFDRTARVLEEAFGWPSGSVLALLEEGIPIVDRPGDADADADAGLPNDEARLISKSPETPGERRAGA